MRADWILAMRWAGREMRGGIKGFRVFLACLALGVAAIAAIGSFSAGVGAGLKSDGRALLGGDVDLRLMHREASAGEHAWLAARGRLAATAQLRAMAYEPASRRRTLVELKAVDRLYPLYGTVDLAPAQTLQKALAPVNAVPGVVVEAGVIERLKIKLGDRITIGEATFEVRATIVREPDRGSAGLTFGPRAMVATDSLPATKLVRPGSLVAYHYRLALAADADIAAFVRSVNAAHPDAGWRVLDWANANPGLRQFVDRVALYLGLVGLTALLVGGIGVGNAVGHYLDGKTATIATLKCLGATAGRIFQVYLIQVFALAVAGIGIGLLLGAVLPAAVVAAFGDRIPVPVNIGLYPQPLLLAALYGVLVGLGFALWPLARAREVAPARLFRQLVSDPGKWPRPAFIAAVAAIFAILAAVAIATTDDRFLAMWFVGGTAAGMALLTATAKGFMAAARRMKGIRRVSLRTAIGNIGRPGAPTVSMVLSLGIGLALLTALALVHGNLSRDIESRMLNDAPAFYFIDIQPEQVAEFDAITAASPGIGAIERVPWLRGRIVKVAGRPSEDVTPAPDQRWVLRGDRGLTFAEKPPAAAEIVAGVWWPANYDGPPLVSLTEDAAIGLGIGIGDSIAVNVLGREVEARIGSLRRVDWSGMGLNFVMIFSPNTLAGAPISYLATVKATSPAAEDRVWRAVTDRFANVSAIRMKEVLEEINGVLTKLDIGLNIAAAITWIAGVLVLGGAVVAGHRRRTREVAIFKVLGAMRGEVIRAHLLEYAAIGLVSAALAGAIGWLGAWAVVVKVMHANWTPLPATLIGTTLISLAATGILGLAGTWRALAEPTAAVLRQP